jgi:hypothetical protein
MLEVVSSADGLGGNQNQTGPRSETLVDDEVKHSTKKCPEEITEKQNKSLDEETEINTKAVASFQQQPNWTIWFGKPDHLISLGSGQKRMSRTTAPGTAPTPRWCPPRHTLNQRRRIQRMMAQKLREKATEKEIDEYVNTIRTMFPTKQEWRVKEKASTPAPTTSDDDMDLLDDNESPLIKDGSPPLTDVDINMVFTLPAEFRGVEEEVTQMCLDPKEAVFKKPEESSQHMKPLYV